MLKETETKKTIDFFFTFLSLVAFQLGAPSFLATPPPLATPMCFGAWNAAKQLFFRRKGNNYTVHVCSIVPILQTRMFLILFLKTNVCYTFVAILSR